MVSLKADATVALTMLMDRLSWPVKMARWKTAKAIKGLIEEEVTREAATAALLRWLADRRFESEVASGLGVLLVIVPDARPSFETLCAHIAKPSLLSEMLVEKMYGGRHCGGWEDAHSGAPPEHFAPSDYFDKHKGAHVPRIFSLHFEHLEKRHDLPFMRQWAYEWHILTDATRTAKTSYPYYFGDFALSRSGVVGQFVQRQGEVYRSAYLRTLAFAMSAWEMPPRTAASYVFNALSVLPNLFDVEPQRRPQWLGDLPALCLVEGADLEAIGRRILKAGTSGNRCLVALGTPFPADLAEFGDLTMSAFFLTDDFTPSEGQEFRPVSDLFYSNDLGFNASRENLKPKLIAGRTGSAISVCSEAQPVLHGLWHDDYFQRGLLLPAPYCFEDTTIQRANTDGLNLLFEGEQVAEAMLWHDAWTPLYAGDSPTRCGIATTMRHDKLDAAAKKLGMKIGWCVHATFMQKEGRLGDLSPKTRAAFFE
jgi:hypothetical protein